MVYGPAMIEVRKTEVFDAWMRALRSLEARARILVRIDRLAAGNPGNHRALVGGVNELKIDHGPGYRVYYHRRGSRLVILLCGGDKSTQRNDIRAARAMVRQMEA